MRKAWLATTILFGAWMVVGPWAPVAGAAELRPDTIDAFNHYVTLTEKRMDDDLRDGNFLYIDSFPANRRAEISAQLQRGELFIEQLHTREDGQLIRIPNGLIHHWIGITYIPSNVFSKTIDVLQDYAQYAQIYKPDIRKSALVRSDGDLSKIYLQLYKKSLVTVVLNANFDARSRSLSDTRAEYWSYSTRIAELRDPGGPDERELPVGNDHGYLWRLYSYWRIEQKDGGVYLQVESIALSRPVPVVFAWVFNPIIRNLSRAVIADLLNATVKAVNGGGVHHAHFRRK